MSVRSTTTARVPFVIQYEQKTIIASGSRRLFPLFFQHVFLESIKSHRILSPCFVHNISFPSFFLILLHCILLFIFWKWLVRVFVYKCVLCVLWCRITPVALKRTVSQLAKKKKRKYIHFHTHKYRVSKDWIFCV